MILRETLTKISFLAIFWIFFWPTRLVNAQSLGTVEVTAGPDSVSEGSLDSTAFVSTLEAKDFKDRRLNLAEAVKSLSGVTIKQQGGLDDFATVSIRGSNSEQVMVYLDGVPLNQGFGGAVNLAAIPIDQIDHIEVYKGLAPARYAGSAIGGVIDIRTKKAGVPRDTRLIQSYGSFKTYELSLLQSQAWKKSSYQTAYTYTRSAGDFSFEDDHGTPFNPDDDRILTRRNNAFSRHNALAKADFSIGSDAQPLQISLTDQFFQEGRGVPGLATLTSDTAHLATTRNRFSAAFSKGFKNLNLSATPFLQYQKQQYSDPGSDIGLGVQDNNDDTFQYGVNVLGEKSLGKRHRITSALDYRGEIFSPENNGAASPSSRRDSVSLGLEDEIYFWDDRVVINPSLRTEHIYDRQDGTTSKSHHPVSGKIGLKVQPTKNSSWTFKTNVSRAYRIPSFSELYGDRGTFVGNPNLSPEKSWNWDIGAGVQKRLFHFEVIYFLHQVTDLIQLLQTSQFTVEARNLSKARIQGLESSVSITPWKHMNVSANYTFQWPKDISGLPGVSGKFLPGRPRHEASGMVSLFNNRGRVFADLTFQDGNFLDTQNILRVDHRLLLGSGFSFCAPKPVTWSFEAKNLLNDRISDLVGFPLPGRSFYARMEWGI